MPACPTCNRPLPAAVVTDAVLARRLAGTIRYWLQDIDEGTAEGQAFADRAFEEGIGWGDGPYCGATVALIDKEVNGLSEDWASEYGASCYRRVAEVAQERGDAYKARPGHEAQPGDTVVVGFQPGTVIGRQAGGQPIKARWWGGHITVCIFRVDDDTGPGGRSGLWCIGGNQRGTLPGGRKAEGVTLTFYPFQRKKPLESAVMWLPAILASDYTGTPGPTPTAAELAELLYLVKAA